MSSILIPSLHLRQSVLTESRYMNSRRLFFSTTRMLTSFDSLIANRMLLCVVQDNAIECSIAAIREQFRQLLCETQPSVLLRCRPLQASEVSRDVSAHFHISSSFSLGSLFLLRWFCMTLPLKCGF